MSTQMDRAQVEAALERLAQAGLIGPEQPPQADGTRAWMVAPVHQHLLFEVLRHPERWDDVPALAARREELTRLRERALKKGLL